MSGFIHHNGRVYVALSDAAVELLRVPVEKYGDEYGTFCLHGMSVFVAGAPEDLLAVLDGREPEGAVDGVYGDRSDIGVLS
jgi:hypothetical protein